ncbi:hypothetical protein MPSEU_000825600 [Mayamaea pseudoterrestris]|nr:hypothetical protein MPSEU_000825600 [Mayamaea pseudoterrestris]
MTRDNTESMSDDDDEERVIEFCAPCHETNQSASDATMNELASSRKVVIREDLNVEHMNWEAERNEDEMDQCFVKRWERQRYREDNAACVLAFRRWTLELGMDWDDCHDNAGSVRGLEEFLHPNSYHKAMNARTTQRNAVLKAQDKQRKVAGDAAPAKREALLRRVASRHSQPSVTLALHLAQREGERNESSGWGSILAKVRLGFFL